MMNISQNIHIHFHSNEWKNIVDKYHQKTRVVTEKWTEDKWPLINGRYEKVNEDYFDPSVEVDPRVWMWQFLRRNQLYQETYKFFLDAFGFEEPLSVVSPLAFLSGIKASLKLNEPEVKCMTILKKLISDFLTKNELPYNLANPVYGLPFSLNFKKDETTGLYSSSSQIKSSDDSGPIFMRAKPSPRLIGSEKELLDIDDEEIPVMLDIRSTWSEQVKKLKLIYDQKKSLYPKESRRNVRDPNVWLRYLRIIDARKSGLTQREVGEYFSPDSENSQHAGNTLTKYANMRAKIESIHKMSTEYRLKVT